MLISWGVGALHRQAPRRHRAAGHRRRDRTRRRGLLRVGVLEAQPHGGAWPTITSCCWPRSSPAPTSDTSSTTTTSSATAGRATSSFWPSSTPPPRTFSDRVSCSRCPSRRWRRGSESNGAASTRFSTRTWRRPSARFVCAAIVVAWRVIDRKLRPATTFSSLFDHAAANLAFWGSLILAAHKETRLTGCAIAIVLAAASMLYGRRTRERHLRHLRVGVRNDRHRHRRLRRHRRRILHHLLHARLDRRRDRRTLPLARAAAEGGMKHGHRTVDRRGAGGGGSRRLVPSQPETRMEAQRPAAADRLHRPRRDCRRRRLRILRAAPAAEGHPHRAAGHRRRGVADRASTASSAPASNRRSGSAARSPSSSVCRARGKSKRSSSSPPPPRSPAGGCATNSSACSRRYWSSRTSPRNGSTRRSSRCPSPR